MRIRDCIFVPLLILDCNGDSGAPDASAADANAESASDAIADVAPSEAAVDAGKAHVTVNAVFPPDSKNPLYATFNQHVLTATDVDGINPVLVWSAVDHGPGASGGQYQWPAAFDAQVASYVAAGKRVNIIVEPVSEGGANSSTPSYVLSAVDTVSCGAYTSFPIVWESAFKDNYKAFIAVVIARYATNPNIGYMRFGLTVGGEIYPFCGTQAGPYLPDASSLSATIFAYDAEMLAFEKQQNPAFPIVGPTTAFGSDDTYVDQEAANAVAQGFGFGSQGLQAKDVQSYPATVTGWGKLFSQYVGQAPLLELQTYGESDPSGACATSDAGCLNPLQQATGPLPPLLALGVQGHANTFEIYTRDLLVAYDPANPAYTAHHQAYADAIAAVHAGP